MEQLKKKQQLQKKIGEGQAEKAVTPNKINLSVSTEKKDEPIKIEKPSLEIQADLKKTGILRLNVPFKHIPM